MNIEETISKLKKAYGATTTKYYDKLSKGLCADAINEQLLELFLYNLVFTRWQEYNEDNLLDKFYLCVSELKLKDITERINDIYGCCNIGIIDLSEDDLWSVNGELVITHNNYKIRLK